MDSSAVKLACCLSLGCIFAFSHFSEQIYDFLLSRKGSFPDAKYQSALYKKLRPLWQPEHSEKNSASFLIRTRIVVEPRCVVLPHYFFFFQFVIHLLLVRFSHEHTLFWNNWLIVVYARVTNEYVAPLTVFLRHIWSTFASFLLFHSNWVFPRNSRVLWWLLSTKQDLWVKYWSCSYRG